MWSNISAPKSALKAAQVGHQVKQHELGLDQQENNRELCRPFAAGAANSDSPLMRYKHAVCSSPGGFIYIHGGRFANGVPLDDDVWRFDPHENRWLQLETGGRRPPSLQEHSLNEYQDRLYLFGGQVSAASGQEDFFWRLDLASRQWSSLSMNPASCNSLKCGVRLGPTNRRGHSACIYRDSIYIFGGYEDFRGSTNQLWQYDLLNERWELRNLSSSSACHPEPRHNHSAVIYKDSMYIYGGLSNLKSLADLWRWSWKDKRWFRERTRGQSPGQLHGHTAIQAFGSMFVFGGERQNGRTTRSLWRLNLSNLSWQKIKPKGPRPNPTTWHAAIANPLGVLDAANYLVEGDAGDLDPDQQQHQQQQLQVELSEQQHDELMLVINQQHQQQSASDNCFSASMQRTTIPMETIRPVVLSNANNQHRPVGLEQPAQQRAPANGNNLSGQPRAAARLKLSKSTSDQMSSMAKQTVGQPRDRVTKTKRRLHLSFLRRNKVKRGAETKLIPTSWSATSILGAVAGLDAPQRRPADQQGVGSPTRRYTVATDAEDIEMLSLDPGQGGGGPARDTTAAILDSLDTDIKGMFERAMSPDDGEQPAGPITRDSMTQSQLSSCVGPTTTSQTYQTARDHLSSPSTMTITAGPEPKQAAAAGAKLADVRQRRSVHQFNQARGRPKSEIVQSLIDRADARIKHLYTPYLHPEASQPASHRAGPQMGHQRRSFDPSDSVLGELANHRMFERAQPSAGRRATSHDKSKRHTIHQTMTYYNLYFAEERRADGSSGESSNSPPATSGARQDERATPNGTSDKSSAHQPSNSTSAALVGVHEATNTSSCGGDSSRTLFPGRLESEVGSLMQSSDSRTLCADPNEAQPADRFQRQPQDRAYQSNGFGSRHARLSEFGDSDDMINQTADNTSLSFSAIAEFEEDDMLQYSSPTDLVMDEQREPSLDGEPRADQSDEEPAGRAHRDSGPADKMAAEPGQPAKVQPQKSASSGYDSMRSSSGTSRAGYQQQSAQPQRANETSSCSASSNCGSPRTDASSPRHQGRFPAGEAPVRVKRELATTTASSTTAESLALTTNDTNTSESCPLTPPSKSLPASPPDSSRLGGASAGSGRQHSPSFAASLMSGPSRLFGRKRAAKTRYWQLCMFVIGGKQQGGHHNTGNLNEPIAIWRLYI